MHTEKPSLTIVMTTYNGEAFLEAQLNSILAQSYQDFEMIICDDASTDNTYALLQSYQKKHPHIHLYRNSRSIGSVKNFEKGIALAKGDYIALSDQDDLWREEKLALQVTHMKRLEAHYPDSPLLVHSDLRMINEENQEIYDSYFRFKHYKIPKEKNLAHMLGPCGVMGNTILMNQALKARILPFPQDLAVHDYWIALINELYGERETLYTPLVDYRIHRHNLSNSSAKLKKSYLDILKRILKREFRLPYREIGREKTLAYLLETYTLERSDIKTIKDFMLYLEFKSSRLSIFSILLKYGFIKPGLLYRLKMLMLMLLSKRA